MLTKLHIQNYAIIEKIEINFSAQLNIITGETGAGKSILMGALSLILGERADTSVLLDNGKKCVVEGHFHTKEIAAAQLFLKTNDLDEVDEVVLRREIAANGKSRAFINDTPVTLQQMKQLASILVDLHQQFDTLELGDIDFQREVIDALAANSNRLKEYQLVYHQWQQHVQETEQLKKQREDANRELDYNKFLFNELNEASFQQNELEDIEIELKLLSNSEGIKTSLSKAYFDLVESEEPVVTVVKQMLNQLQTYAGVQKDIEAVVQRLQSAHIELKDIADDIDNINNSISYDEKRINYINERIAIGYKLLKKHNVHTTNELLQIKNALEQKLLSVTNMDETIAAKEKATAALLEQAESIAQTLSVHRNKQLKPLQDNVNKLLHQVGMPNARLKTEMHDVPLNQFGKDAITFLFDGNLSNRFEPIKKVASGGELSRLMLCIKSLVAQSMNLPTMIFDEIDTGISGEAAKQVGIIMKSMAAQRQIICITHQPQIAGKANAHFFVYKNMEPRMNDEAGKDNTIKTGIRLLNEDERITALAKMLSGEKPSAAALESAREMMN